MKVNKIIPQGYCQGVTNALAIMDKAIKDEKGPIYSLGSVIHNTHVIDSYQEKGIITIEEKGKTRMELLDKIPYGTVIFSAHGVSPSVYEKAEKKGLKIIDATCPMVLLVHKKITKYLNDGYTCLYIGAKGHPECEGVLGISEEIRLITSLSDIESLSISSDKIYVTNQTTLSVFDIEQLFDALKKKYPSIIIDDKICNATTVRQMALANQPPCDLCIIVGDKKSSNSLKLYKVSSEIAKVKTVFTEDLTSLDKSLLKDCKTINISSGASTPSQLVEEIIQYLEDI